MHACTSIAGRQVPISLTGKTRTRIVVGGASSRIVLAGGAKFWSEVTWQQIDNRSVPIVQESVYRLL